MSWARRHVVLFALFSLTQGVVIAWLLVRVWWPAGVGYAVLHCAFVVRLNRRPQQPRDLITVQVIMNDGSEIPVEFAYRGRVEGFDLWESVIELVEIPREVMLEFPIGTAVGLHIKDQPTLTFIVRPMVGNG